MGDLSCVTSQCSSNLYVTVLCFITLEYVVEQQTILCEEKGLVIRCKLFVVVVINIFL